MRNTPNLKLNRHRVRNGPYGSDDALGNYGMFMVPLASGVTLCCVASEGSDPTDGPAYDWEHVSVSVIGACRCPTWEEMCAAKNLFWRDDETVIQYHPARDVYRNEHPWTLHLWRHRTVVVPTPDPVMIGRIGGPPSDAEVLPAPFFNRDELVVVYKLLLEAMTIGRGDGALVAKVARILDEKP